MSAANKKIKLVVEIRRGILTIFAALIEYFTTEDTDEKQRTSSA